MFANNSTILSFLFSIIKDSFSFGNLPTPLFFNRLRTLMSTLDRCQYQNSAINKYHAFQSHRFVTQSTVFSSLHVDAFSLTRIAFTGLHQVSHADLFDTLSTSKTKVNCAMKNASRHNHSVRRHYLPYYLAYLSIFLDSKITIRVCQTINNQVLEKRGFTAWNI